MKLITNSSRLSPAAQASFPTAIVLGFLATVLPANLARAELPPGKGQTDVVQVCGKCHSPELAASQHQSHQQWEFTIYRMIGLGAQGSDEQFETIVDYLAKNFGKAKEQ